MTVKEKWQEEAWFDGVEQGIQKDIQQGMQQGIQHGIQQGIQQALTALNELIGSGMSYEDAVKKLNSGTS